MPWEGRSAVRESAGRLDLLSPLYPPLLCVRRLSQPGKSVAHIRTRPLSRLTISLSSVKIRPLSVHNGPPGMGAKRFVDGGSSPFSPELFGARHQSGAGKSSLVSMLLRRSVR